MADGRHLKNKKVAIYAKQLGKFWRNFFRWHILTIHIVISVQKLKFLEIQEGVGRHFQRHEIFNLCSHLTDFKEILNAITYCVT